MAQILPERHRLGHLDAGVGHNDPRQLAKGSPMRDLRFDGLSGDGTRLVLVGKDGQRYTVVIDERLEAAVRRDRARISQVELEQSGTLRPREIQARIRAGATAEDVSAASGLPVEHIRRFEGPVLTERAWVAQQAQATEVRRPGGDIELGDLVLERLTAEGVEPTEVAWDAWRRDDGLWVVIATFPLGPNTHVATWTYDSGSRTMTVADDNARALSAIDASSQLLLSPVRPTLTPVVLAPPAVLRDGGFGQHDDLEDDEPEDELQDDDLGADGDVPEVANLDALQERAHLGEPGGDAAAAGSAQAPELDAAAQAAGSAAEGSAPIAQEPDASGRRAGAPQRRDDPGADSAANAAPQPAAAGDESADTEDPAREHPAPTPPAGNQRTTKPPLPSFDDILFGPGPRR
jgi:hypothetical protein